MKVNQLVSALMFAATILLANAAWAQVKIGANPGTIGASSNLEVEAANGNKTIVDKATGQVTIQDGTQGSGKLLTSDVNGAASWQTPASGKLILGTMPDDQTAVLTLPANGTKVNLGASITLPPGKWLINVSAYLTSNASGGYLNVQAFLSSSPTAIVAPVSLSNTIAPGFISGQLFGSLGQLHNSGGPQIIDVTTTTTYYVLAFVASQSNAAGVNGGASMSRKVSGTEYFFAQSLDY